MVLGKLKILYVENQTVFGSFASTLTRGKRFTAGDKKMMVFNLTPLEPTVVHFHQKPQKNDRCVCNRETLALTFSAATLTLNHAQGNVFQPSATFHWTRSNFFPTHPLAFAPQGTPAGGRTARATRAACSRRAPADPTPRASRPPGLWCCALRWHSQPSSSHLRSGEHSNVQFPLGLQ